MLVADGIKVAKTGRKMPVVKKLHQESDNNSKPVFIFGHSCQAVSLIVRAASSFLAVPLSCRIHEGVVFSNRDKRSLLDKLVLLVMSLGIEIPFYLVADTYCAAANIIRPLLKAGQHLVTAVRSNAVAYAYHFWMNDMTPCSRDTRHAAPRARSTAATPVQQGCPATLARWQEIEYNVYLTMTSAHARVLTQSRLADGSAEEAR